MAKTIKKKISTVSSTNTSLNQKSLRLLSSLRDVMRILNIEESKKKDT